MVCRNWAVTDISPVLLSVRRQATGSLDTNPLICGWMCNKFHSRNTFQNAVCLFLYPTVWESPISNLDYAAIYGQTDLMYLMACTRGCFNNVSRALQNILSKFVITKIVLLMRLSSWKFQLEIINIYVISGVAYFREIILESSRNVSETTPRPSGSALFTPWLRWPELILDVW